MRITDNGADDQGSEFKKLSIYDSIKAKSQVGTEDAASPAKWERPTGTPAWEKGPQDSGKVTADVQSNKLKQLLGQIKTQS
jgi:hypothetical protein